MAFYYRIFSYRSDYKQTLFAVASVLILFANLSGSNIVKNVNFDITEKSEMVIHYTLSPVDSDEYYKVETKISADGGKTWFSPKSIRGDVGQQKGAGAREIIWDIFSDMEELEGDIKVKVTAKWNRTLFQKIFLPPRNSGEYNYSGLAITLSQLNFLNAEFQQNIKSGIIKYKPGWGIGVLQREDRSIINFFYTFDYFEINKPIPYQCNEATSSGFDAHCEYGEIYDYIELRDPDQYRRIFNHAFSYDRSYILFPNLFFLSPSVGLGVQYSTLGYTLKEEVYYNDNRQSNWWWMERTHYAQTSACYTIYNITTKINKWVINISYKQSLINSRKWNQTNIIITMNMD